MNMLVGHSPGDGGTVGSYRHDAVVDHAAHLDVVQVAVPDVCCQAAGGSAVRAGGGDQPLDRQGLEELSLQVELGAERQTTGEHVATQTPPPTPAVPALTLFRSLTFMLIRLTVVRMILSYLDRSTLSRWSWTSLSAM